MTGLVPSPASLPLLSLLVLAPALGALLVAISGEDRPRLRRVIALASTGISLALAALLWIQFEERGPASQFVELRPWIDRLGVSYQLGVDGLSVALAGWVALLTPIALLVEGAVLSGRLRTALILAGESTLLGLFFARDVFLLLAFLGGGLAVSSLLAGEARAMRRFFAFQFAGLVLVTALAAVYYRQGFIQTGFTSTELARWSSLVSFPHFEARAFLAGLVASAFFLPLFPLTWWLSDAVESMAPPARLFLLGGFGLVGSYLLFRLVVPLSPSGALAGAPVALGIALASIFYGALARYRGERRRSFVPLLVGYQGLVLAGLFSFQEAGVVAAQLQMLHLAMGITGLALWTSERPAAGDRSGPWPAKAVFALLCASLLGVPGLNGFVSLGGILAAQWERSRFVALLAGIGFALMALRLLISMPALFRAGAFDWRRRSLLLLPILAVCVWIGVAPGAWKRRFLTSAELFLNPPSGRAMVEIDP